MLHWNLCVRQTEKLEENRVFDWVFRVGKRVCEIFLGSFS